MLSWRAVFRFVAPLLALGAAGCVESMPVTEDNGTTAWDMRCSYSDLCLDEAAARCASGYIVQRNERPLFARHQRDMRIQCVEDYASGQAAWRPITLESPPPQGRGKRPLASLGEAELLVCSKAYERFPAMAQAWSAKHVGDEAAQTVPPRATFLDVCTSLPEPQQLCLIAPYEAAHRPACADQIAAMPEPALRALDAMMLKSRDARVRRAEERAQARAESQEIEGAEPDAKEANVEPDAKE